MELLNNPFVLLFLFVAAFAAGGYWKARQVQEEKKRQAALAKQQPPQPQQMQLNAAVMATVMALAFFFQLPSLSIDINGIFSYAFDVVNAFMPLIAIIAGLGLGFNLITKISSLFNKAF